MGCASSFEAIRSFTISLNQSARTLNWVSSANWLRFYTSPRFLLPRPQKWWSYVTDCRQNSLVDKFTSMQINFWIQKKIPHILDESGDDSTKTAIDGIINSDFAWDDKLIELDAVAKNAPINFQHDYFRWRFIQKRDLAGHSFFFTSLLLPFEPNMMSMSRFSFIWKA